MIEKYFIVTSNYGELRINRVWINRFWPVMNILETAVTIVIEQLTRFGFILTSFE